MKTFSRDEVVALIRDELETSFEAVLRAFGCEYGESPSDAAWDYLTSSIVQRAVERVDRACDVEALDSFARRAS